MSLPLSSGTAINSKKQPPPVPDSALQHQKKNKKHTYSMTNMVELEGFLVLIFVLCYAQLCILVVKKKTFTDPLNNI